MSINSNYDCNFYIRTFWSPAELTRSELICKAWKDLAQDLFLWQRHGYESKDDFKKCFQKAKFKSATPYILSGFLKGDKLKKLLKLEHYSKLWCFSLPGLKAIVKDILTPDQIAGMNSDDLPLLFSK